VYRSKDLRKWEYLHPLASGHWTEKENTNPVDSGEMWECPDFFPLGKKHVLLYSTAGEVIWEVGELDSKELVFHPQKRGVLDHGAYYAQKTQLDSKGNRILWGWIPEKRLDSELIAAGWAGCMALPRVLSLGPDDELLMRVAAEAKSLRGKVLFPLPNQQKDLVRELLPYRIKIENLCGELTWTAAPTRCTFELADNAGTRLAIKIAPKSSAVSTISVSGQVAEIPYDSLSMIQFDLYLDGSVSELICNNRYAFTVRHYSQPNGPLGFHSNASAHDSLVNLRAWQLKPISPDRLTTPSF